MKPCFRRQFNKNQLGPEKFIPEMNLLSNNMELQPILKLRSIRPTIQTEGMSPSLLLLPSDMDHRTSRSMIKSSQQPNDKDTIRCFDAETDDEYVVGGEKTTTTKKIKIKINHDDVDTETSNTLVDMFNTQKKQGWKCPTCLITNDQEKTACAACETPNKTPTQS
jgi:hypothetical protein